jgi:hypothetical protein
VATEVERIVPDGAPKGIRYGIGFGGPPIRINARPEVTVFVLEPATGEVA